MTGSRSLLLLDNIDELAHYYPAMAVNESRPSQGFWANLDKAVTSRRVDERQIRRVSDIVVSTLINRDLPNLTIIFDDLLGRINHTTPSDKPLSEPRKERLAGSFLVVVAGAGLLVQMQEKPQEVYVNAVSKEDRRFSIDAREESRIEERGEFEGLVDKMIRTGNIEGFHQISRFVAQDIILADRESLAEKYESLVFLECSSQRRPHIRNFTLGVLDIVRPALQHMNILSEMQ